MKITKVDVMMLKPEKKQLSEIGAEVVDWSNLDWRPIVCRIHTDEGIYGDGEAAIAYGYGAPAAFGMVKDLASLIIGMDPLDNEVIWDKLYKQTFWGQNGGPIVFSGISAIDIALWDIKGKYFNVPVYKLLGGKKRDKLRSYASQLQFGWGPEQTPAVTTEDYVKHAMAAVAEGYDAIKVDFFVFNPEDGSTFSELDRTTLLSPKSISMVEERLSATREAIGPNVDIIMENHSFLDAQSAIQIGKMAEKYNIYAFEEPNTPTPKTAKYICDKLGMPIASGERIYTRWQYAPYFEDQSIQLIQPDLGTCGGITEGKKICDMAYTYDISVQLHVCASPLSTAAALHVEAVIPNFAIHEHHRFNLLQYNKDLCIHDYQPKDGYYEIPELPGLGNELSEFALNNCDKVVVE